MPTYEYKCSACGHAFERFESIMAAPLKKCPECGKAKVKRLMGTGAGIIFKGSGFYITDYRSEGYKEKAKADSGAAGGGDKPAGESAGAAGDSKGDAGGTPKADSKGETGAKPPGKGEAAPAADSKPAKTEAKPEPKSASKSASKSAKKR